nr:unnamed protein product [Spirometra erinaceieuropaei]
MSPPTLAAWNVRCLLDNPTNDRPERRTALVARELARYKLDIAAPRDTPFSEQGQMEEREKATWRHPRSRQWHPLYYVLVRRRDQRDVLGTKAIAGADGWTDHCLVISKMCIRLQPRRRPQVKRPPGNELAQRLDNLPIAADADAAAAENASMANRWSPLRDTVQSTALAVLGRAWRQHQDWFDDNDAAISNLLVEKNCLQKAYVHHSTDDNRAAFYRSRHHLQLRLRRHVKRRG